MPLSSNFWRERKKNKEYKGRKVEKKKEKGGERKMEEEKRRVKKN